MLPEEVRFLPVTAIHRAESFGPAVGSPAAQRHGGQGKFIHTGGRRLPRNLNRRGQKRDRSCFLMFSSFQFFFFFPEFLDCLYVEEKLQINLSTSLIHLVSLTGQPDDGWLFFLPLPSRQRIRPKKAARWIGRAHPRRSDCTLTVGCNDRNI